MAHPGGNLGDNVSRRATPATPSLHRDYASYVSLTDVVYYKSFRILPNDEGCDKRAQLAVVEQIRRVPRTTYATSMNELQVPKRECLVDEGAARPEQAHERRDDPPVQKVDAEDGVNRVDTYGQRAHIGGGAEDSRVASGRRADGGVHEVHDDDRSASPRDGYRMTPRPARDVDEGGVRGQCEALFDDPCGRSALDVGITVGVSRFPVCTIVPGIESRTHR
jgi:hypothetical protein